MTEVYLKPGNPYGERPSSSRAIRSAGGMFTMKLTAVDAMMKSFPDIPASIAIYISVAKAEVEASETLLSLLPRTDEI